MGECVENNLSALLVAKDTINLVSGPPVSAKPGKNEVLLRMGCVSICGSDIHYWKHMRIGDTFIVNEPMVLGHESSGTVIAVGEGVTHLNVNDRVAIEPGVPCRMCSHCKQGRYNLCKDVVFLATPPVHGSLRRYHIHAADFCYKLPENVSLEEGAMLEPLSVAVHANRRGMVGIGDRVLIIGSGPIGLMNGLTARASGASFIVFTDINDKRLAIAKQLGADAVINVMGMTPENVQESILKAFQFDPPNKCIECSGAPNSLCTAVGALKSGGVLVIVGMSPKDTVPFPAVACGVKEIDVRGVFRYANCYPIALNLLASGHINVKQLVSHRFTLSKSVDAFLKAASGDGIKVMINCSVSTYLEPVFFCGVLKKDLWEHVLVFHVACSILVHSASILINF